MNKSNHFKFPKGTKVKISDFNDYGSRGYLHGTVKKYYDPHNILVEGDDKKGHFWSAVCCNVVGCDSFDPVIPVTEQKINIPKSSMWQSKQPKKEGYYWIRMIVNNKPNYEITYIYFHNNKLYMKPSCSGRYKWIGPIEHPIN
jgi:hypothetical protein